MSLINEALKKAQWQRNQEAVDTGSGMEGAQIAKRKQPKSATTVLLLGSVGVVLVVLTAVITVFWFNRPAAKPAAVAAKTAARTTAASDKPTAATSAPITVPAMPPTPPAVAEDKQAARASPPAAPTASTTPVASKAAPEKAAESMPAAAASKPPPEAAQAGATATAPATPPAPVAAATNALPPAATVASASATPAGTKAATEPPSAAPAKPAVAPDERVQAWVESVKIGGVRASGTESKVFMNDRLFRLNDIVNRTLNIRLSKVENDSVTFSDANGVTYVRNF